jgi:hypothetical protein
MGLHRGILHQLEVVSEYVKLLVDRIDAIVAIFLVVRRSTLTNTGAIEIAKESYRPWVETALSASGARRCDYDTPYETYMYVFTEQFQDDRDAICA